MIKQLLQRLRLRPEPHVIDRRSLRLFRFGLGCYVAYDVVARAVLPTSSIYWYTSSSTADSTTTSSSTSSSSFGWLRPLDSPHGNIIHKIWFARTSSVAVQYLLFATTFILAVFLAIGWLDNQYTVDDGQRENTNNNDDQYHPQDKSSYSKKNSNRNSRMWTFDLVWRGKKFIMTFSNMIKSTVQHRYYSGIFRWLLWILVVSMQHKNMHVHDGSDNYTRQLLLWYNLIPKSRTSSVPSLSSKSSSFPPPSSSSPSSNKNNDMEDEKYSKATTTSNAPAGKSKRQTSENHISSLACFGLTLQMTFMYLGTIFNRTLDKYYMYQGTSQITYEWLPPDLSAVHYIMRDSFAIRDYWLVDFIRYGVPHIVTQGMTLHAMMAECSVIIWVFCPCTGDVNDSDTTAANNMDNKNDVVSNMTTTTTTETSKQRANQTKISKQVPSSSTSSTPLPFSISRINGFYTLFPLHFGLLLVTRLPNWQWIAMVASIIWIPSKTWDQIAHQINIRRQKRKILSVEQKNITIIKRMTITAMTNFENIFLPSTLYLSASENKNGDDDGNDDGDFLLHPKKTDAITPDFCSNEKKEIAETTKSTITTTTTTMTKQFQPSSTSKQSNKLQKLSSSLEVVRKIFTWFFFIYMIYNFLGQHSSWTNVIKHDGGDIGEFFRTSQYWVMYGTPPKNSVVTNIVAYATLTKKTPMSTMTTTTTIAEDDNDHRQYHHWNEKWWMDVMKYLRYGYQPSSIVRRLTALIRSHDNDDRNKAIYRSSSLSYLVQPISTSTTSTGAMPEDDTTTTTSNYLWHTLDTFPSSSSSSSTNNSDGNSKSNENNISLHTFISARWERALDQWGRHRDERRAKYMLQSMCKYLNFDVATRDGVTSSTAADTTASDTIREEDEQEVKIDNVSLELIWTYYDIVPTPTTTKKTMSSSTSSSKVGRWKITSFPRQIKVQVSCIGS